MNVGERIDTIDKPCRGSNEPKSLRHFRGTDAWATKLCVDPEFSYESPHQGVGDSPIWATVKVPKLDVQEVLPCPRLVLGAQIRRRSQFCSKRTLAACQRRDGRRRVICGTGSA